MYYLNKLIGFVLSPFALILILLLLGGYFIWKGKPWFGLPLSIGGIVCLIVFSMPIMGFVFGVPLEDEFLVDGRVPMAERFENADAIVLLGGGMGRNVELSHYGEMSSNADRVWQAARLWKAGKAPIIISTGFDPKDSTLGILMDFGVNEKNIVFLEARNTEEEAKIIRKQMSGVSASVSGGIDEINSSAHQLKNSSASRPKVLLVTSAWHMKRARMMFEKYAKGVEVVCAPADFEYSMIKYRDRRINDLMPDAMAFFKNSVAVHEWIGLIGYKFFR